jgi:hypothetical protein
VLSLIEKKLISLGKKYFSIPLEHLPYYPEIPSALYAQIDNEQKQEPPTTCKKKQQLIAIDAMVELTLNALASLALVKARPGHPKKKVVTTSRSPQKLTLQFFSK